MSVHNHPPYRPPCNERRTADGQLRGACLTDDGRPMTADDRGATVPEAHIDAVAQALAKHRHTEPDPAKSTSSWIYWRCQCGGSIRGGHDRHIAREILAAVVPDLRTPEGRDKVLAALVETGTLSPRFGVLSFANRQIVPTDSESAAGYAASRLKAAKMRRLVTEWTEVEP